jgi:hypothetical protein
MKPRLTSPDGTIVDTDEFVVWSIRRRCQLRELLPLDEPLTTERHLRPIRSWKMAQAEHRCHQGICLQRDFEQLPAERVCGFREADIETVYGGFKQIESACSGCPANAWKVPRDGEQDQGAVGCFGFLLRFPFRSGTTRSSTLMTPDPGTRTKSQQHDQSEPPTSIKAATHTDGGLALEEQATSGEVDKMNFDLAESMEQALADESLRQLIHSQFDVTEPAWYGLWKRSSLVAEKLRALDIFISKFFAADFATFEIPTLIRFHRAVRACIALDCELDIQFMPTASNDGLHWTVNGHCSNCGATHLERVRFCQFCRHDGGWIPPRRRKLRGTRPYRAISEFLDPIQAEKHMAELRLDSATIPQQSPLHRLDQEYLWW